MIPLVAQLAETLGETVEPWKRRAHLRSLDLAAVDIPALVKQAVQKRASDAKAARRIARGAWTVARMRGDKKETTRTTRVLAQTHIVLGEPLRALQRLAAIRAQVATSDEAVHVALTMSQTLMMITRTDEAVRVIQETRASLPRRGHAAERAQLDVVEGSIYLMRGESSKALEFYERGRKTLARLGHWDPVASIDINRATALTGLEEYKRAERLYARGARVLRGNGQGLYALQADYNHAYLRFVRGYFHDALDRFRELREQFAAANDRRHVAMCDLDEAEISLHMNLPMHAANLAARASGVLKELGIHDHVARAEFFRAVAARSLGHTREALHRMEAALETFQELKDETWLGICLHRLAEIDLELGAAGQAASRAASAARRLQALGLRERAGYAVVLLASIEFLAGEDQEAETRLRGLLSDIDGSPFPWLRCEIHHTLARVHESRGETEAAFRHVLRATRLLEAHRVAVPPDEYMAAFLTGKAKLFRDAARIVLARESRAAHVRAFELVEQARGRALLDLLRYQRPRTSRHEANALQREAYRLEREIDGLGARMPARERGASGEDAERRAREAARREERLRMCLDRLAKQDPAGARLRRGAPPRFREVAECLTPDETLVEYFMTGDELITFVVHERRLEVLRRPLDSGRLRDLLQRTSFQIDRPNLFDRFDAAIAETVTRSASKVLSEVHDLLLAPARDRIHSKRVIIVPHGDLSGVPFHALERGGRPLLMDHEVVQAPSASVFVHCRAAHARRSRTALLLGVPDETAPHIRAEVEALADVLPQSRRFIGVRATEATLRRYGRHARLIHIAAHARFRHDDPMESGVKLADGWLTIPRIAQLRLRPELLVLAGCATGRVSVTEGGELFGLVRGFLQAGAASLVTSLWPVPDTETARFMQRFYANLEADRAGGPAAALRQAALSIRDEQPHPFHWAPFLLMGGG